MTEVLALPVPGPGDRCRPLLREDELWVLMPPGTIEKRRNLCGCLDHTLPAYKAEYRQENEQSQWNYCL